MEEGARLVLVVHNYYFRLGNTCVRIPRRGVHESTTSRGSSFLVNVNTLSLHVQTVFERLLPCFASSSLKVDADMISVLKDRKG